MKRGIWISAASLLASCTASAPEAAPPAAGSSDIEITVAESSARPAPPLATVAVTAPSATATGLPPTCESYFSRMRACTQASLADLPGDARQSVEKAMADAERATRDAWSEFAGDALEQACAVALDALSANPACPP